MVGKTKSKSSTIEKAETVGSSPVVRPSSSVERGQPRIYTSGQYINQTKDTDLRMPFWLSTADNMAKDEAVFTSIEVTNVPVGMSLYGGEFIAGKSNSRASREAAEFFNYNIRNMSYGTWWEYVINAITDLQYGFSLQNIVLEKRGYGTYKGMWCIKKLAPRDQKSVYAWVYDTAQRDVLGFVQKPPYEATKDPKDRFLERGIIQGSTLKNNYAYIKKEALLWNRYNPKNDNPEGDPPLKHCYDAWVEKKLVERYQVIGVTKDMGGLLVLRVDPELIQRASDPSMYPNDAAEYTQLQADAASLHAGDSSYIVLSSESDESSKKYLNDISLLGVDGGGKQYSTNEIIDQKKKAIYNAFGASVVILGEDGGGSYSLSSNKMSIHEFFAERAIQWKVDVINSQLIPTILKANNINLSWNDMPTFRAADPSELSLDEAGKFLQRAKSVGALTKEVTAEIYRKLGFPIDGIDELDFTDKGSSRAGESMGTSGTGNSQSGGLSSTLNSENGGAAKSLVLDGQVFIDTDTGELVHIDR